MSYIHSDLMIVTSTLVVFILVYLNTYVLFPEARSCIASPIGATMAVMRIAALPEPRIRRDPYPTYEVCRSAGRPEIWAAPSEAYPCTAPEAV